MLYRRSTQVALQAALLLAGEPPGGFRRVREIAMELGIPTTYLSKVIQDLTRVGLVQAVRGPGGGVRLVRSPREIRLWDVLAAMEPLGEFERCFLKLSRCDDNHPCPLHNIWLPIRAQILGMLQSKNLWELAIEGQCEGAFWEHAAPAPRERSLVSPREGNPQRNPGEE